jgi:hypothetical protein
MKMKSRVLLMSLLTVGAIASFSAQAFLVLPQGVPVCHNDAACNAVFTVASTTTMPLLLLADSETDMSSGEAKDRLIAEASGDADSDLLLSKVALDLETTKANAAQAILAVVEVGENLTNDNIRAFLK